MSKPCFLKCVGNDKDEQEKELRLEGTVASRSDRDTPGKQWVIDYDERSPFHSFVGRRVVVSGEPCKPPLAHVIMPHLRVFNMRLVEVTPDAELLEVTAQQHLAGRFKRGTSDTGESTLSFVTEQGDTFLVANDSDSVVVGCSVKVQAYPVHPSPSIRRSLGRYLWVIYPCSCKECFAEWLRRNS